MGPGLRDPGTKWLFGFQQLKSKIFIQWPCQVTSLISVPLLEDWASLLAQSVKNLPAMQETRIWFLSWEDPWEKEMANYSSILAWRIPWWHATVHGVPRFGHDLATKSPPLEDFFRVSTLFPSHQPSSHGFALGLLVNPLNLQEEIWLSQCIFLWQSEVESQSVG